VNIEPVNACKVCLIKTKCSYRFDAGRGNLMILMGMTKKIKKLNGEY